MRNEMGNQNTSRIIEAEKAVIEVPEAGHEDEMMKEENGIIQEDQTEDLPSAAAETSAESQESDKNEQGKKKFESDKLPEAAMEPNNSVSQLDYIEKADLCYESNMENLLPVDDELQIYGQFPIGKENLELQAESSSLNSEAKSGQDSNPTDDSISQLEEFPCPSLNDDSEEAIKLIKSYHRQKDIKNGDSKEKEDSTVDLVLEEKPSEWNVGTEKYDQNGMKEIFENGHTNNSTSEVPQELNFGGIPSSPLETVPEVSSPSLAACPEPQVKHIVLAEEMKVASEKSENGENKPDSDKPQSSGLAVNQVDVSDLCKENGDENKLSSSCVPDLEKVLLSPTEANKLIQNGGKGISVDREKFVQETEKRTQEPWSTRKSIHGKRKSQGFHSFGGENEVVLGYHNSQINSKDGLEAAHLTSSINSLSGNGTSLGSGAAEDQKNVCLKENISYQVLVNEISSCTAQNGYVQIPTSCNSVHGLSQKAPMRSATVAPSEISLSQSNKQIMTEESTARLSIDSNPDHSSHRVQLRKSPSFEFGLPLDARSEESDQTPLLVRDMSLARSFSGSASVKFQNSTMLPSDYGRKSLDYEPIQVEEKTIRMERSNSDISKDSFMNFLNNRDVNARTGHTPEKEERPVAGEKVLGSPSQELALTSVKANGKRRPRSSLFSACICCSAVIH